MKRLLLLAVLLIFSAALFNISNIYAATENSQASDTTIDQTKILNTAIDIKNNSNIQSSAGNLMNKSITPANDTTVKNLQNTPNTTDSKNSKGLNKSISNLTNVQNSTYAAGDNEYKNVHAIWLKAEDVGILNVNEIKRAGITDIFIKTNFITNPTYQNVLTALLNKVENTDIRVHAWITCFKDVNGSWINPANITQRTFLIGKIEYIVRNYNIDGIHLDYVRYSGVGDNAAYKNANGTETITSFIKDVYNAVKGIKAKVAVSAAVMPECSQNAYLYGQDYAKMAPYLDFLVPMIYKGNYKANNAWIGSTTQWIAAHSGGKPVIAGIQTYRSDDDVTKLSSAELKSDIKSAINNGASGYALFRYGMIDSAFFNNSVNISKLTNEEIKDAAIRVKKYIETNHQLPDFVEINGREVSMYTFLYLLSTAVQNVYNNNSNLVDIKNYSGPQIEQDSKCTGNMGLAEYIHIADVVKVYMDKTGVVPGYAYGTSLGTYFGWKSMIYMYSTILDSYSTNNALPRNVAVKPIEATPNTNTLTNNQIKDAATRVKNYINLNHQLPKYVTINGKEVSMYTFLYLLSTAVQNVYNNNSNPVDIKNYSGPQIEQDSKCTGNMGLAEYIHIADVVKVYMDKTGVVPGYAYGTSLGTYFGWKSMIYMYSTILDSYSTNNALPRNVAVKPIEATPNPNLVTYTNVQIKDAAVRVKNYIESNQNLPNYVQMGTRQVSMSQFLQLVTTALIQINSGVNSPVMLKSFQAPVSPAGDYSSGTVNKAGYIIIAQKIKLFMDSNSIAPNYASSNLGTIQFETLVYMYSRVLNFENANNYLPNYVTVEPWTKNSEVIPGDLQMYLQETANCQVNDYRIKALASSLTSGASSTYDKGVRIFNWVRDNLEYSFYYDTRYGAVNTYLNREGNCVDHSHLLIALARAAKIPARYMHGTCTFNSGSVYGHVWAQLYVNGKWYNADAISYKNSFGSINNWNTDTVIMNGNYAELPF